MTNMDEATKVLHAAAIAHGYVDEVCSQCGTMFMAHVHFIRCEAAPCPMRSTKDPRTLLERLADDLPESNSEAKR